MQEPSKSSAPSADANDERAWVRQLRRDRRAALATMEEGAGLPGPGAAGVGRKSRLMRYGVQKSWAASGLQSVPQAERGSRDDASAEQADNAEAGDGAMDTGGAGDPAGGMGDTRGLGGSRFEDMSASKLRKERGKNSARQAGALKKTGGLSDKLSQEKGGIEREIKGRAKKFTRFTLPSITMWRVLVGEFVTPIVDFTALHGYAIASVLGIKTYAPKKLNVGEWLLLIVIDGMVLTAMFLMIVLMMTAIAFVGCLSEFYSCGLPLLPSVVSGLVF